MTVLAPAPPAAVRDTLKWAPVVFVAATALGVVMRLMEVGWRLPVPFDHLLHAHSHSLYFGWAGLVILASSAVGIAGGRRTDHVWWSLVLVPVMAVAFLTGGYWPPSIAASTAVMIAWYAAVWTWWRSTPPASPALVAERTGFLYVILASAGIWVLAPVQALDLGPPLVAPLAVHAFLGTFAWFFVIGTAGLLARVGVVSAAATRLVVLGWRAVAWLSFPLGVVGGPEVALLGPLGRLAGVAQVVPTAYWVAHLWNRPGSPVALRLSAVWLGVASLGMAAAGVGGSTVLESAGRHGVVLYLHALLLGYVTGVLAWYLGRCRSAAISRPLHAHHVGVATMLVGLGLAALGRPTDAAGLWLAAAGALVSWLASCWWAPRIWRASA